MPNLLLQRHTLLRKAGLSLFLAFSIILTGSNLFAAKPGGGSGASCGISPTSPTINAGQSINFSGSVSGKSPKSYSWTFEGGSPPSSIQSEVSVNFATAGSFIVTLDGANGKGGTCSESTTVTVNGSGGGSNNPPAAQDNSYNTTKNQILNINAPGILANDSDPDGDAITASLETDVSKGNLLLNSDGSFSYTPNTNFFGQDSFTYTAVDNSSASSNVATVTIQVADNVAVSINSTSQNSITPATSPVTEQTLIADRDYTLVAINDLGMHCGDLDTRISSILPPFNVLHAQVIERGINGNLPRIMNKDEVLVGYSAASNPDDPILSIDPVTAKDGSLYKTNFWDIAREAYSPFYPSGILDLFYPTDADIVDLGLPVPDVERFYLEDGELHAGQQAMPGIDNPLTANTTQLFHEHIDTMPFFINFPFGYKADLNLFEAAGVPIAVYDDFGRENPYPLMRVQAGIDSNTNHVIDENEIIASVDTVMPISGEAECQRCHADPDNGGNGSATQALFDEDIPIALASDDPATNVPSDASIEWASDQNILALHDLKHSTNLNQGFDPVTGKANNPIVCQTCHYTPALDLAQFGPLGPENDNVDPIVLNNGAITIDSLANGRDQVKHKSMSNVMHSHHGQFTDLFPAMPPAVDAQGNKRDPAVTADILGQTCYSCHPGTKTECMRGAMANGGQVCQDCHGDMAQVGDDFTRDVSPTSPGAFHLAADYYTNPETPRVPWANEPGCGSCHTGNAIDNLAADNNTLTNPTDSSGNSDGIRLAQAFRADDAKATPIVPVNKQFAENVVTADDNPDAAGNPKLYRVSTGHGGLFCESCHGSTHAEWPNANPVANDNVTAEQIQGHSGTISECTVCHEGEFNIETFKSDMTAKGVMQGPHGMHPVDSAMWNEKHKEVSNMNKDACKACHGGNLTGTVLSRTAADRNVRCKSKKGSLLGCSAGQERADIPKGTPIGCGMCHAQKR